MGSDRGVRIAVPWHMPLPCVLRPRDHSASLPTPEVALRPARRALPQAACLLFVCLLSAGTTTGCAVPLGEAAEMAAQGGETRLQPQMRPIRGGERVLIIALDGVGDGALHAALAAGRLPSLARLLGPSTGARTYRHGYAPPDVLTTLPSTTMAAWATVVTGAPPAETGVPGNEWFDRTERRFHAPAPVSVTGATHTLQSFTEGWLGRQVQVVTLFERADVRSHVSLLPIHRGADLLTTPNGLDLFQVLSIIPEGLFGGAGFTAEAYIEMDEESVGPILDGFAEHGIPDVQLVYFPGVDLITHASDPPLEVQQRHLEEVIAPGLARIFEAYRRERLLDDTWIVVIADHGHTPVQHDDEHALGTDPETDPPAVLDAVGFRVRAPQLTVSEDDYSAVLAYQGAFAYVYLADRSTCPEPGDRCDWSAPPRFEEDVLPVANAYLTSSRHGRPVAALEDRLDLVLARRPVEVGEIPEPFSVLDGGSLVPVEDWLRDHPRPDWLRFAERLRGLAVGPHGHLAGDVLLVSRLSPTDPIERRSYFSGPYHSWHGSPTELDSVVPMMVLRPGGDGDAIQRRVERVIGQDRSTERFVPLVLDLLQIASR